MTAIFDTIRRRLEQHLALDLRTLGFFRMGLGLMLMWDFFLRMQDTAVLYSGAGVLPVEALKALPQPLWSWFLSVNVLSDHVGWQCFCMGLGILGGFLLMIGWRSKWVAPLMLIWLHSVQARNPWTNYGADKLLFLLLLWSCFLPLDRYFSVRKPGSGQAPSDAMLLSSWAAWGLRLQVCVMYLFSVLRKTGPTWLEGTALRYALEIDAFVLPWGLWLKTLPPGWLQGLTYLTLFIEAMVPMLLLARGAGLRILAVAMLVVLQGSFWLTLDIGIFPLVSTLAVLPHLPGRIWSGRTAGKAAVTLKSELSLPRISHRLAGWMLVFMLIWNCLVTWKYDDAFKDALPRTFRQGIHVLRMNQYWSMFSPNPMVHDGWYVLLAETEDGRQFDLLDPDRQEVWDKPDSVRDTFPSDRFKEYMMQLSDHPQSAHQWEKVVDWIASSWRSENPGAPALRSVQVFFVLEKTLPEGVAPLEREQLWPVPDEEDEEA